MPEAWLPAPMAAMLGQQRPNPTDIPADPSSLVVPLEQAGSTQRWLHFTANINRPAIFPLDSALVQLLYPNNSLLD